jgi:hypothetical protein
LYPPVWPVEVTTEKIAILGVEGARREPIDDDGHSLTENNKMHQARSALVLQGGGALGAYELGAARALYKDNDFSPDVIAGVSIGAITAVLLSRPARGLKPLEALEAFWKKVTVPGFMLPPALRQYASFFGNRNVPRMIFHHGAAGGCSAAVARIPILGRRHCHVPGRADLHRHRLLDLPLQGGQGCARLLRGY